VGLKSLVCQEPRSHKKLSLFKYIIVAILVILVTVGGGFILLTFPYQLAYADVRPSFREFTTDREVTITTEDGKRFTFGQDFEIDISEADIDDEDIKENPDAKNAKVIRLERGETITVEVEEGIEDTGKICLADRHRSDSTIARSEGSCGSDEIEIVDFFECDSPQEPQGACDTGEFEVEIPEDIDKGKYKIVIGVSEGGDEILNLFINKVRIKQ
jgi:hypothetical protein